MEYREYDSLPLKIFAKILKDESSISLLGVPKEQQKEVWDKIKSDYGSKHPSREEKQVVFAHKKAQLASIGINRLYILLNFCFEETEEVKSMFSECGHKWSETVGDRIEYLDSQIKKETAKLETFKSELENLEKTIKEKRKKAKTVIDIQEINDGLASLEINNIQIGDYDLITCGRYDSLTRMLNKKAQKQ